MKTEVIMGRYTKLRREWAEIIEGWQDSGLSGAEFCRRNAISLQRFYSWRRRFRKRGQGADGTFVPLQFSDGCSSCGVTVVLGSTVRLELAVGFNAGELVRAVNALRGPAEC